MSISATDIETAVITTNWLYHTDMIAAIVEL